MTYTLPAPEVIDVHLESGYEICGYTAEQMRNLRDETIEECARVCDEKADAHHPDSMMHIIWRSQAAAIRKMAVMGIPITEITS